MAFHRNRLESLDQNAAAHLHGGRDADSFARNAGIHADGLEDAAQARLRALRPAAWEPSTAAAALPPSPLPPQSDAAPFAKCSPWRASLPGETELMSRNFGRRAKRDARLPSPHRAPTKLSPRKSPNCASRRQSARLSFACTLHSRAFASIASRDSFANATECRKRGNLDARRRKIVRRDAADFAKADNRHALNCFVRHRGYPTCGKQCRRRRSANRQPFFVRT